MKKLGKCIKVDMETGDVVEIKNNAFSLLPPREDVCQECATDHEWDQPHNQQSMYYQYRFYSMHDRWPTWTDAMQHCSPDVRKVWKEKLIEMLLEKGMEVPEDLLQPKPEGR